MSAERGQRFWRAKARHGVWRPCVFEQLATKKNSRVATSLVSIHICCRLAYKIASDHQRTSREPLLAP